MRVLFSLLIILLMAGCGQEESKNASSPVGKTLAVGKFRLTGSAETGQYAQQLFKVDRLLVQEMARKEGWQVMESDRVSELMNELEYSDSQEPGYMDALMNSMLEKATGVKINKSGHQLPSADYILIGEMDGFDMYYDDSPQTINGVVRTVKTRTRKARTRISFRVVDVKNRKWFYSHSRNVEVSIPDERNAESQVDMALSVMVREAVATIGEEEVLPVVSTTALQKEADGTPVATTQQTIKPVTVAFGGFSIYHPDVSTDLNDVKNKLAGNKIDRLVEGSIISIAKLIELAPVTEELEAMITHRLKKSSGLKVMEQNTSRLKKMLAQQVLADLSKGRQPGLPMGTLKGVDYLVFGIIHDLKVEVSQAKYIDSVAMTKGGKPKTAKARMHLYLQDVNTGEHVLSEELNLEKSLIKYKTIPDALPAFMTYMADESIRRFLLSMRPMEVMWAEAGSVILNHGEMSGLRLGDILDVYSQGRNMTDPYTGSVMKGVGSTKIASIKVTTFSPSGWAEAAVVDGNGLLPGQPVKHSQRTQHPQIQLESKPAIEVAPEAKAKSKVMEPAW